MSETSEIEELEAIVASIRGQRETVRDFEREFVDQGDYDRHDRFNFARGRLHKALKAMEEDLEELEDNA